MNDNKSVVIGGSKSIGLKITRRLIQGLTRSLAAELENCFEGDVVGRYAGQLNVVDPEN